MLSVLLLLLLLLLLRDAAAAAVAGQACTHDYGAPVCAAAEAVFV
jgi:hypothetical protein